MHWKLPIRSYTWLANERGMPFDNQGNKIILPSSILTRLLDMRIQGPFFFQLGKNKSLVFGCDFQDPPLGGDAAAYIPTRYMLYIGDENTQARIDRIEPVPATMIKLKYNKGVEELPFNDLENPKGVLEYILSTYYAVLAKDTSITFEYIEDDYTFQVEDVQPADIGHLLAGNDVTLELLTLEGESKQ